jgi:hypothetical protein
MTLSSSESLICKMRVGEREVAFSYYCCKSVGKILWSF